VALVALNAPNVALGALNAPNVAFGASNAPNVALVASNAPNATLGRMGPEPGIPDPVVGKAPGKCRGRSGFPR